MLAFVSGTMSSSFMVVIASVAPLIVDVSFTGGAVCAMAVTVTVRQRKRVDTRVAEAVTERV
jgi:hypothetical protein